MPCLLQGIQMSQVTSEGQVAVVADVFVRDTPLAVTAWRGPCVRSRPFRSSIPKSKDRLVTKNYALWKRRL